MSGKAGKGGAADLQSLLGHGSVLLDYTAAVVAQLAGPAASESSKAKITQRIAHVLRAATSGDRALALDTIVADPKLLASLFQNADLLDTSRLEGAAVAEVVMEAVGQVWEEAE